MWGNNLRGLFSIKGGEIMKNPIKEIKQKNNWSIQQFASAADISFTTAYNCLNGTTQKINGNILEAIKVLGYDPEEIKKEYQKFRQAKQQELIQTAK